jgi:hypothetical protein
MQSRIQKLYNLPSFNSRNWFLYDEKYAIINNSVQNVPCLNLIIGYVLRNVNAVNLTNLKV